MGLGKQTKGKKGEKGGPAFRKSGPEECDSFNFLH